MVPTLALLLLAAAPPALAKGAAQPSSKPSHAALREAKRDYRHGVEHMKRGDYARAIQDFQAALDAYPNPLLHFNIAQAYRLDGDAAQAVKHYQLFLQVRSKGPDADAARAHIVELNALLEKQGQAAAQEQAPPPPAPGPAVAAVPAKTAVARTAASMAAPPKPVAAPLPAAAMPSSSVPHPPEKRTGLKKWWPLVLAGGLVVVGGALGAGLGVGLSNQSSLPDTALGTVDFR